MKFSTRKFFQIIIFRITRELAIFVAFLKKGFWVIPEITIGHLCKSFHDVIIISFLTCVLNLQKVGQEGGKLKTFEYLEKGFFGARKSVFHNFLSNSNINRIFLWRLPIQNYWRPSITEKRRNKAKYLTWNYIRLMFVKKNDMPIPVKSLEYIKCYSSSSHRPVKSPSNSIR